MLSSKLEQKNTSKPDTERQKSSFESIRERISQYFEKKGFIGEQTTELAFKAKNGTLDKAEFGNKAMECISLSPNSPQNEKELGKKFFDLLRAMHNMHMISQDQIQEYSAYVYEMIGGVETDINEQADIAIDLNNPSKYREYIKQKIEEEYAEEYGFEKVRFATDIINSMAKSTGYSGPKTAVMFKELNSSGDELTDKLIQDYLNSDALLYLEQAQTPEQVSGFINSL